MLEDGAAPCSNAWIDGALSNTSHHDADDDDDDGDDDDDDDDGIL